nr:cation diffusion facilitator family transporter [Compostimonas suwonensis]
MLTVLIAFLANLLVAVAKSVAATITGSASMLAEAAHSWADTGNEIFLIVADRRSARRKDEEHPLGYGREAYVWSLFAAVGIFTAGAVVSVFHGVQELFDPEPASDFVVAYVVLGISLVLEGFSFTQAFVQARRRAQLRGQGTLDHVLTSSNTTLRAVFAEDAAALIGLVLAAAGIALHQITGNAAFDAAGSILIGLLLAVVAIILIDRNRRFLVGAGPTPEVRSRAGRMLLASPEIERVTYLHLEFVGPDRLFLVAAVDLVGDRREEDVAVQLRRLERVIEQQEYVETAVLSLSVSDEPSLEFVL